MDWLETTQGIITLISSACVMLGGLVTFITLAIKRGKEIVQMIKDKKYTELIASLKQTADAAIRAAETTSASGADKKTTVLEAVQAACKAQGVDFSDELQNQISTFIDTSVAEYNQFKKANESK